MEDKYRIDGETKANIIIGVLITSLVIGIISGLMFGIPKYNVWSRGLAGRAELAQAESNRKIKIAEAEATREAASALAEAEIIRAKGVAEANKIIGNSLKNNEAYLRYLYVNSLADNKSGNIIYVPTEAGLPILEAGKRH